jgi:hypothetical protein
VGFIFGVNMDFTQNQPKDGDIIVTCKHFSADIENHVFRYHPPKRLEINEKVIEAKFFAICEDCFKKCKGNADLIPVCGYGVWSGDEPSIIKNPNKEEEFPRFFK